MSDELNMDPRVRGTFPECPNCDEVVETDGLKLNEQVKCPHCGATLLLVRLDGVVLFLKNGWL